MKRWGKIYNIAAGVAVENKQNNMDKKLLTPQEWLKEKYLQINVPFTCMMFMHQYAEYYHAEKSKTDKVTRVEVISAKHGRVYTNYNCGNVRIDMQDDNRTVKVFLTP